MGFFKNLFCGKKKTPNNTHVNQSNVAGNNDMHYYIYLDNEVYGPFSLQELKNDYPILEDTLITTNTLNGEWYEAKYFECFDELFTLQQDFYINEYGEMVFTNR